MFGFDTYELIFVLALGVFTIGVCIVLTLGASIVLTLAVLMCSFCRLHRFGDSVWFVPTCHDAQTSRIPQCFTKEINVSRSGKAMFVSIDLFFCGV